MVKVFRDRRLTLDVTEKELYLISRKARVLGVSRANLVVNAVIGYEGNNSMLSRPDNSFVTKMLDSLPPEYGAPE